MSTFNQTNVAQELANEQREISIAEFFEQNKQMLGFGSKTRSIVTAIKEGVDNSLDAAEDANILPDVRVTIEEKEQFYTVTIEDNGPGIPKGSLPNVFGKLLYGSRFDTLAQSRGQQGIGISAAVLYSQLTSGNPARVTSKTKNNSAYYVEIGIDTDTNEPILHSEKEIEWDDKEHGIKIELDMEGNMRARKRLYKYIRNTAVVNPHATVELHEPNGSLVFDERPIKELPDDVEEIKPHPHGVELGTVMDMLETTEYTKINSFLQNEFTRVGQKTADEIMTNYKNNHYGCELSWPLLTEKTTKRDYRESFFDHVRMKGEEATDIFFTETFEQLNENEFITYSDIKTAVNTGAEVAGEETFKQFAETVQENAIESVLEVLEQNIPYYLAKVVSEETIDRKPIELTSRVARQIEKKLFENDNVWIVKENTFKNIISEASDEAVNIVNGSSSFGDTAQEKIYSKLWENTKPPEVQDIPKLSEFVGNRDHCKSLLMGMQSANAMAPPTKCLSPITEEHLIKGLKTGYDADFYTASTRSANVAKGQPFIVEAGIAYGGDIEPENSIILNRYANRVPLVYQKGACAITKTIKGIRWNSYYTSKDKLSQSQGSLPQGPMVLVVHIASTNVPFTSESKDAVASVPEIEDEIERAVRDVARDLKDHMKKERTKRKRKEKQNVIGGLLNQIATKLENITEEKVKAKEESQARILNNVYIKQIEEDTFELKNYSNKKESFILEVDFEDSTEEIEIQLESDETDNINVEQTIESFTVTDIEKEKLTRIE